MRKIFRIKQTAPIVFCMANVVKKILSNNGIFDSFRAGMKHARKYQFMQWKYWIKLKETEQIGGENEIFCQSANGNLLNRIPLLLC